MNIKHLLSFVSIAMAMSISLPAVAATVDPAIAACLKAWGKQPFGANPTYKTLGANVKVFGIGSNPADTQHTSSPSLVLVDTGVNVMGRTRVDLLNPNGWYCFKSNVNVMGSLIIKADCKAHLASAHDGSTVLGSNSENKSVTVMGATRVELVGCK